MLTAGATGSTDGRAESDDIPVWVRDGSLPLAVILVPRAVHFEPRLSPLLCYLVGVLTVNVDSPLSRKFVSDSLGKVNREVPVPVGEGIAVIVERHPEARILEPSDRSSDIGNFENWLEP